ncbi:hypothetical protein ACFP3Q_12525 [Nocardioides sp. GCM10027113]|uniref:hypothetical protein n=1 Tax=unclassified Nocardioides TaxID=2615069 RepID=UPI003606A398
MVDRVFVHIGLPKTATSYLQTIFWANRDLLRERGVVVPGSERRDHLWASRTVREDPAQDRAPEQHRTAWERIRAELATSSGTGLVSHEFFAAASAAQARRMVEELPTDDVHLVVTAREPLGLFTASWQESLKNGATTPMPDYARTVSRRSTAIWNWRTLDLRLVLERWSRAVPPERIHVLVLDPDAPREDVWHRFASVVGFDHAGIDTSGSFPNTSMGVAEAETLRRVNGSLRGFNKAFDRGVYIRSYLADERLVPRRGERFWPEPDQVEDCRERGEATIAHLQSAPYDVNGRLEHLRVPAELEPRRSTTSVTDTEVADVAVDLVATMLGDVRRLRSQAAAPGGAAETGARRVRARLGSALRRLRRR